MYRCIKKYVVRRWFVSLIFWKYGDISAVVGIFIMFPGNVCCWCIKINSPPLGLLYGCP
jgi:hypothetical protein